MKKCPLAHKLILGYVLKLIKCNFSSLQTSLSCHQIILLEPISVSKSIMSVSSNSIDQILNFALKLGNRKFKSTVICDEGDGLVAVNYICRNQIG